MKQALFLAIFAVVALTGVYAVITLYDSNLKAGRMDQTPVIRPHEEPLLVMDNRTIPSHSSETLTRATLETGKTTPESTQAPFAFTPTGPAQDRLAKGKKDYQSFCSHCHGPDLDGLGTVGQSFFPLPTNLTRGRPVDMSDEQLFVLISYGGKKSPALASSMSVDSRNAVIQYIRFIQETSP